MLPDNETKTGDRFRTPDLVIEETGVYVPEQQAYLQIMRTAELLGSELSELFGRHGLSGKQYNVLRALRRGGPAGLTASEIGAQMTDHRADVTRLVDRLVRDGLVKRLNDQHDRRIVRTVLTERGCDKLKQVDAPLIEVHRRQLGHMSERQLGQLIRLLKRVRGE